MVDKLNNGRILYMDALKGFAILLVVMGHTIAWNFSDRAIVLFENNQPNNIRIVGLIFQFIYSFHMPLFFLISGFFSYKETCILKKQLKKKTVSYFVPYLFSGVIIYSLFGGNDFGYWFLLSLFELSVLSAFFSKFSPLFNKTKSILLDLFILFLPYLALQYILLRSYFNVPYIEIWKFGYYYVPFFCGYLLKKYDTQLFEVFVGKKYLTVFFVTFLLSFLYRYLEISESEQIHKVIKFLLFHVIYDFTLPLSGCLFFVSLFRICEDSKIKYFFSEIGKYTLGIYLFHMFFVIQIPAIGNFWLTTNLSTVLSTQICYSAICSLVAISISIVITKIVSKSTLFNFLLLGKYKE